MAQFARPDSDIANPGVWITAPLFGEIDEAVASDADFIQTPSSPVNAACEIGLSDVTDPAVSTGHIVRYRFAKTGGTDSLYDLTVELLQGATVIASWFHTNWAGTTVQSAAQTLSGAETDAITDYTDLRLQFTGHKNAAGGLSRRVQVMWAEFETPDAVVGGRKARVYWGEFETPDPPVTDRKALVYFSEFEVPEPPRRARVYWIELQTPDVSVQQLKVDRRLSKRLRYRRFQPPSQKGM